jgi:cell division protein FtsL
MSDDLAYAIKKDIRNNPVFREADARQKREFARRFLVFLLAVAAVVFSVRQQNALRLAGYDLQKLSAELERERTMNRQLRLNLETMQSPRRVEEQARTMGLRPPRPDETLVLERAPRTSPSGAIVARVE